MDNVQKHNTCNNISSSQTFKSHYVIIRMFLDCTVYIHIFVLKVSIWIIPKFLLFRYNYSCRDSIILTVCRSGKLLMVFASTVILGSGFRGTDKHIFLSRNSGSYATTLTVLSRSWVHFYTGDDIHEISRGCWLVVSRSVRRLTRSCWCREVCRKRGKRTLPQAWVVQQYV
jgi:hypothetical protein